MVCRLGGHFRSKIERCVVMELNDTFNFNLSEAYHILLEQRNTDHNVNPFTEAILIGVYGFLIVVGLLANILLSIVIARRPQMHTARNLYIVNLTISDITLCLICMPFTLVAILRRQWNLGLALCKLVPALQGTNTMVSVGTITVIALDRYYTIIKGQDGPTTRRRVIVSIALVWFFSVLVSLPLVVFQVVEPMMFGKVVLYETCIEDWPNQELKVLYTLCVLMIQAVIPAGVVGCIHAKIASYLHSHAKTQRDSRRAQRELQRNKRTTMLLSGVAVLFAVSWLPLGLFSLWADLLYTADSAKETSFSPESFFVALAACHVIAMSSAVSNPIVYGWLNSNIRRELLQLFSSSCSMNAMREGNGVGPTSTMMLCQNGQRAQHQPPATTYSAL
ncbi:neuropeptide F receptor-like [Cimex lectularius]|uniref:G-protein coupled receptors family 1 profile domain-containing protein n=1 Tax=Cimex lectularius TaxID=79782 RepID=A0A8I6TJJ0_CIMLE|nr:neuropeptide F receptor-like [Cimex lectularius]XP_014255783.1 neuropeptide F receptor-like [Cimex lectularius]